MRAGISFATILRSKTCSGDGVSQARFVLVDLPAHEIEDYIDAFESMQGRGPRADVGVLLSEDPHRNWWPDQAPNKLRAMLVKAMTPVSFAKRDEVLGRLACGEWILSRDLPAVVCEEFRRVATDRETKEFDNLAAVVGPPVGSYFPKYWEEVFTFLQRCGVSVRCLPACTRGGDCPPPEFSTAQCYLVLGMLTDVDHLEIVDIGNE